MKNKLVTGIFYAIAGILYIIGPYTIFRVCDSSEHIMKCHWSVQAEIGSGILFIVLGALFIFLEQLQAKLLVYIIGITNSIIAILIPLILIGGCANSMMACRSLTFPAFYLIAALIIIFSSTNIFFLFRVNGNEEEQNRSFEQKELV